MLFNSYVFCLVFLPLVLIVWWLLPSKNTRLAFLTLASYVFYGWWDVRFVPLMILSTSADYIAGKMIHKTEDQRRRTLILIALLTINLGILAVFKYWDFIATNLNAAAHLAGHRPFVALFHLVLPVGISFYTFNSISYTIDIYRRRVEPARNFLEFATFVALFPHLVAGPIVRYSDLHEQFERVHRRLHTGEASVGVWFFVLGMAKKVIIADHIAAAFVQPLFVAPAALKAFGAWLAALAYTLQIYFDFSGYSDMAVGLALLLGFHFPQNFNSPYKALNISDFWRRWHMSLSFWLRDYLFIPLGGSRGTKLQTARNLLITMFLGGLWHGASWTFVIWGLFHGAGLAGHAIFKNAGLTVRRRWLATAITFLFVIIGWVLFRTDSIQSAGHVFAAMAGLRGVESVAAIRVLAMNKAMLLMLVGTALVFAAPNTWELHYPRSRKWAFVMAAVMILCVLDFATPSPFLYFQF